MDIRALFLLDSSLNMISCPERDKFGKIHFLCSPCNPGYLYIEQVRINLSASSGHCSASHGKKHKI